MAPRRRRRTPLGSRVSARSSVGLTSLSSGRWSARRPISVLVRPLRVGKGSGVLESQRERSLANVGGGRRPRGAWARTSRRRRSRAPQRSCTFMSFGRMRSTPSRASIEAGDVSGGLALRPGAAWRAWTSCSRTCRWSAASALGRAGEPRRLARGVDVHRRGGADEDARGRYLGGPAAVPRGACSATVMSSRSSRGRSVSRRSSARTPPGQRGSAT